MTVNDAAKDVAFAGFIHAIERYETLKKRLQTEVAPPRVTRDAAEILSRSTALALALQRARPKARQGEFFDEASSRAVKQRFETALTAFDVKLFLADLRDDPTDDRLPRIHLRYPASGSMATMPANLLQVLPELPPDLEYRLVGRSLILRDVDAALILDYLAEGVPLSGSDVAAAAPPHRR